MAHIALAVAAAALVLPACARGGGRPEVAERAAPAAAPSSPPFVNIEQAGPEPELPGAAVCGPVTQSVHPGLRHLARGERYAYPTFPPTSGPHDEAPLPAGAYDRPLADAAAGSSRPSLARAVHSLEHGYVAILYRDLTQGDRRTLLEHFGEQRKVVIAPAPRLASKVALVAWGRLRTCDALHAGAVSDFVTRFRESTFAPEATGP